MQRSRSLGIQPDDVKLLNTKLVLDVIEQSGEISRAELVRATGLSRPTVSSIVLSLVRSGLVRETGRADASGGRPAIYFGPNPSYWHVIGAEMVNRQWTVVICDLALNPVLRESVPLPSVKPETAFSALAETLRSLLQSSDLPILPAIGVGTPGLVDMHTGRIKIAAADINWWDVPAKEILEEQLNVPVYVMNRHRAAGLAEALLALRSEGPGPALYVGISSGVAAALIYDGQLLEGANSSAGELGHVTVIPEGPPCACGNHGCLQELVGGPAIARRARELIKQGRRSILEEMCGGNLDALTGEMVCEASAQDPLAEQVIREGAHYLGIALGGCVNMYNPSQIILGGSIGRAPGILLDATRQEIRRRSMSFPYSVVEIRQSSIPRDAGALGAAALVIEHKVDLVREYLV